jgi:iron complex transport system permease protein
VSADISPKLIEKKRNVALTNTALVVLLIGVAILSLCIGKYDLSPGESFRILVSKIFGIDGDWNVLAERVMLNLRLPRVLAVLLVGGALSVSGAAYQGTFRNPLISPDFLGVSSGACIGAAIGIICSLGSGFIQLFAFIGGIIAVSITTSVPKLLRSDSNIMLVLSGIIVGGLMSSILGFLKYTADPTTELPAIIYWQMGDFSYIRMETLLYILPAIVVPTVVLLAISWWIDILSLGENDARSLGANVRKIRGIVVVCATLLTASAVCIAGTIGWVGLVIPHFARMLQGTSNRRVIPTSFLLGAIFLIIVDTLTRIIGPVEMPISILTGIVGAPFYAWLLYRQRGRLK